MEDVRGVAASSVRQSGGSEVRHDSQEEDACWRTAAHRLWVCGVRDARAGAQGAEPSEREGVGRTCAGAEVLCAEGRGDDEEAESDFESEG